MSDIFNAYAAYYDLLYRDKNYYSEVDFVNKILRRNGLPDNARILELGCGTGKHANYFAKLGYSIAGVDISHEMIEAANRQKKFEHVHLLSFSLGDVRSIRFDSKFNAVISLFHVMSYQTKNKDIREMFETAGSHLESGGLFLFDCWYGPAVLSNRPEVREKRIEDLEVSVIRLAHPEMKPNENVVDVRYSIHVENKKTQQTTDIRETHSMRYFFAPEMNDLLDLAGFHLVEKTAWLSDEELGFETWNATFMAMKK